MNCKEDDTWERLTPRYNAFVDVEMEVERQIKLKNDGEFRYTLQDMTHTPSDCLAVVAEEFGEVSRHVAEYVATGVAPDRLELREELIQLAACCVAWVEGIDHQLAVDYREEYIGRASL